MTHSIARLLTAAFAFLLALNASADLWIQVNGLDATCGNPTGSANVFVSGGTPPYTFLWSNSDTTQAITGLVAGTYSVTVTDAVSDELTGQVMIQNLTNPMLVYQGPGAGLHGCHGQCNNGIWYYESQMPQNLVAPFTFSNPPVTGVNPWTPEDSAWVGFCDGSDQFITSVTDALGCTATLVTDWYPLHGSDPGPLSLVSTTPSCEGFAGGSMTVNVGLEINSAYTPLWNSTLLDATMLPVAGHPIFAKPMLDQNIETEPGLPPGDYFIERRYVHYQGDCVDLLPVTIPSLGTNCGAVNGSAFMDYNENCQYNDEPKVPQGFVEIMPGPTYAQLIGGNYIACLTPGAYTLQQISADVDEYCVGAPIPFTITASPVPVLVSLPDTSLIALDLQTAIATGPARPGFEFQCSVSIWNLTPNASGAITLTMAFDPLLTFLNAVPAPTNVAGNTITWSLPEVLGWQYSGASVRFNVPADPGLIGTVLVNSASVSSVATDGNLLNNSASTGTTITGSYDPNDKTARTSSAQSDVQYFIDEDEWIDYTIRFQNTGTDTAFNILITDTLASTLDPSTLIMGASSHAFTWELRDAGTLKFYFQNILLPDSNYNEPFSHGFVGFRIRPRQPVLPGSTIENTANIFFDFNPPVITEPSVLSAEFSTGVDHPSTGTGRQLSVFPNPANEHIWIRSVSGSISEVVLIAADGRMVVHERVQVGTQRMDLSSLAGGIYALRVQMTDGTIHQRSITKQ